MSQLRPNGQGFVRSSESQSSYTTFATSGQPDSTAPTTSGWRSQAEKYFYEHNAEPLPEPPEVLVWARDATTEELSTCAPIKALRSACEAAGWEVKIGFFSAREKGLPFKMGERAGQEREDKINDGLSLIARKAGKDGIKVTYVRTNGGKWKRDFGLIGKWTLAGDREMKEYIRS